MLRSDNRKPSGVEKSTRSEKGHGFIQCPSEEKKRQQNRKNAKR